MKQVITEAATNKIEDSSNNSMTAINSSTSTADILDIDSGACLSQEAEQRRLEENLRKLTEISARIRQWARSDNSYERVPEWYIALNF